MNNINNELLKSIVSRLNNRYPDYLMNDGKWLIGGYESLFKIDYQEKDDPYLPKIKMEVFMMLPKEMREEIISMVK